MPTDRKPSAIVQSMPPGLRKPAPEPEPPAAIHRTQATSKAFWALMDRWGVPDDKAVKLLDHVGGLTAAGKRPRFAMTGDEAKRFAYLMEIDANLQTIFGDRREWVDTKHPHFGLAPLEYMTRYGERGIAAVHRFLVRTALRR